ncbi:MAG: hypothetical protein V7642_4705 [Burkholderiales bacterium]
MQETVILPVSHNHNIGLHDSMARIVAMVCLGGFGAGGTSHPIALCCNEAGCKGLIPRLTPIVQFWSARVCCGILVTGSKPCAFICCNIRRT